MGRVSGMRSDVSTVEVRTNQIVLAAGLPAVDDPRDAEGGGGELLLNAVVCGVCISARDVCGAKGRRAHR